MRRRGLRLNLAILTGGLLMLCMALPSREKTFVPGELSSKHAQILDNTIASQRCGLCHPSSHSSESVLTGSQIATGLLNSAKRLIENDGRQDQLCMQCHQGHLPAAANRDPHDLSPTDWRQMKLTADTPWQLVSTRSAVGEMNAEADPASAGSRDELTKTSCAMCHNEHHGRGFDIKLISDRRCQACHQRQFESLASGHPEFKNFPVDRPRGLAFSHAQHSRDHFPKKNRQFDCQSCHVSTVQPGSSDAVMRSVSFEHACASCHDQPIRSATVEGWAAIQLPSIEANDTANDAALADWPAGARYGYDGVISPVQRALLMADSDVVDALNKLPPSGKIVDISSISAARAKVARSLAAATRRLLEETARDGQAAWIVRLQRVTQTHLGRELNNNDQALIAAMAGGLPPDLFRHVQSEWLGNQTPLASRDAVPGQLVKARRSQQTTPALSLGDDLLVETNAGDDLLDTSAQPPSPKSGDDILGADELLTAPSQVGTAADLLLGTEETNTKPKVVKLVKGATHLAAGGWYADQSTLSIRYMATGHADSTLAAWALWWSAMESHGAVIPSSEAERITQRLNLAGTSNPAEQYRSLADAVPGKCTECHQLGPTAALIAKPVKERLVGTTTAFRLSNHFQVPEREPSVREFTKFKHTAHLTLPALSDCRYCHQESPSSSPQVAHASSLSMHHPAMSEFTEMKIAQCVACHRPGGANDRCVQCHNYHIDGLR